MYHWANTIKAYRQTRGLTQEQMALAVGVIQKTISRWERGQDFPDLKHQKLLRDMMHKPSDDVNVLMVNNSPNMHTLSYAAQPMRGVAASKAAANYCGIPAEVLCSEYTSFLDAPGHADFMLDKCKERMKIGLENIAGIQCRHQKADFPCVDVMVTIYKSNGIYMLNATFAPSAPDAEPMPDRYLFHDELVSSRI